ncbi:MBL fold metallo-hydrolase [Blastococcus sp. URHD0036]|uniref:MBL fold metallo-hydrolase n=1 Tax=Blastococcus sp. URHD0036 TaxID=1380356 RepID=UPI0018CC34BF|nr:MBL fold metallo-hydrolase [Blastococcus sp. URHD0036]
MDAVSDGTFVVRRSYFGDDVDPGAQPAFFDRGDAAWLPIGCFVVRTGGRVVLVDAGLGPERDELPDGMSLTGGQLPTGLRALGVRPDDVTDVVCTHLHSDHVGWLFDLAGEPVFPAATVWFGAGDRAHFVDGPGEMAAHVRDGFRRWAGTPRLRALTGDAEVAPGIEAVLTPGHTPGHLCLAVTPPTGGCCSSATPSPAPSSSPSRPGGRWETSTRRRPPAPGGSCGGRSPTRARPGSARTSPASRRGRSPPARSGPRRPADATAVGSPSPRSAAVAPRPDRTAGR